MALQQEQLISGILVHDSLRLNKKRKLEGKKVKARRYKSLFNKKTLNI